MAPDGGCKLVSHLGACRVFALRDELEANDRSALRTFPADGIRIQLFVLVFFQPHELLAHRAGSYLRYHVVPRTLRVIVVRETGR